MLPGWHALGGTAFCALLYSFGFSLHALLVIFIATLAIDIDHWLIYAIKKKDLSFFRAYKFFIAFKPNYFCCFHTVEFIFCLTTFSFFNPWLLYILLGFVLHLVLDLAYGAFRKELSGIFFSIIARAKAKAW